MHTHTFTEVTTQWAESRMWGIGSERNKRLQPLQRVELSKTDGRTATGNEMQV